MGYKWSLDTMPVEYWAQSNFSGAEKYQVTGNNLLYLNVQSKQKWLLRT